MPAFVFDIKGIPELTQRMELLTSDLKKEVRAEIGFSMDELVGLAQTDAPADEGNIRKSISSFESTQSDLISFDVVVQNEYAAFLEFGTRSKFYAEPGFEEYAAQFRGQGGGSFKDFLAAIVRWIHRKGITGTFSTGIKKVKGGGFTTGGAVGKRRGTKINQFAEDYAIAYAIAISIYRKGINPHPFLLHNFKKVEGKLIRNLKNVLFSITNK